MKLGLANIITLAAVFLLGPVDAAAIMLVRILLGCTLSGQFSALIYSLSGGCVCYLITVLLYKLFRRNQLFILGILGAIAHNIGQILAAILVTGSVYIVYYLPILIVSAVLSGLFTGLACQAVVKRLTGRFIFK